MLRITGLAVIYLFWNCNALQFSKNSDNSTATCEQYFHGTPWPKLKGTSRVSTVQLCQTQQANKSFIKLDSSKVPIYATLYNTYHRIPVYSANKVILNPGASVFPRPDEKEWKRVATGLCQKSIPKSSISSNVAYVNESTLDSCKQLQAVDTDYYENGLDLDRGHLSPNHINSRNLTKQLATFTLTNAAPQYANFNRHSWRIFECVTEFMIIKLVPKEPVYILTGVYGSVRNKSGDDLWLNGHTGKKRVKVPGYYWKAVCYPGNKQLKKNPWGYAIVQKNVNEKVHPDYQNYISLKEFSQQLFQEPPFGPDCMNAGFGDFATVFSDWDGFISKNCYEPWIEKFGAL